MDKDNKYRQKTDPKRQQRQKMRVNLNKIKKQAATQSAFKMDTYRSSEVQHLREYIIAIENQLKSFETERKTLLDELTKFELANKNMRLEIDYLVNQLKRLDLIIDEKNAEGQRLIKENQEYQQELAKVSEMLRQKVKEVEELEEALQEGLQDKGHGAVGNSNSNNKKVNSDTKIERQIMQIKIKTQVQHELQPKIQQLNTQIHSLKLQLNQKDFIISNLNEKLSSLNQNLAQKQHLIIKQSTDFKELQQKMYQLTQNQNNNQRETQSLKHLLAVAEHKNKQLQGEQTAKSEVINEQQRVVLSDNVQLKREKQLLVNQLEKINIDLKQRNENVKQLTKINQKLKLELQSLKDSKQSSLRNIADLREEILLLNQKNTILYNDLTILTRQNHEFKQQNLRMFAVNQQVENNLNELKNQKQLPKQQYQSLKEKLQQRLQKQQQLKKRHWLEIARYANQIDKLKLDLHQKEKQAQIITKKLKQNSSAITDQQIHNQSNVIIHESENESLRIQLLHEWKEKVDKEEIQKQKELGLLRGNLQDEKEKTSKLVQDLKQKEELLKERDLRLDKKERQYLLVVGEMDNMKDQMIRIKQQLNYAQSFERQKSQNLISSLHLQLQSRDNTITSISAQLQSLNKKIHLKDQQLTKKDDLISQKQTIIKFKDDQIIRKQINFQVEKEIMRNLLNTQIKEALMAKDQMIENLRPKAESLEKQVDVIINQQKDDKTVQTYKKTQKQTDCSQEQKNNQLKELSLDLRQSLHEQVMAMRQKLMKEIQQEMMEQNQQLKKTLNQSQRLNHTQNNQINHLRTVLEQLSKHQQQQQNPSSLPSDIKSFEITTNLQKEHQRIQISLNHQILALKEKIVEKEEQIKRLDNDCLQYEESLAEYELRCQELEQKVVETEQQKDKIQKMLEDSHTQLNAQRITSILLENQLIQIRQKYHAITQINKEHVKGDHEKLSTNQQLQMKVSMYVKRETQHIEETNQLKIQLENLMGQLVEAQKERKQLTDRLETVEKGVSLNGAQVREINSKQANQGVEQATISSVISQQPPFIQPSQSTQQRIKQLETQLHSHQQTIASNQSQILLLQNQLHDLSTKLLHHQNLLQQKELEQQTHKLQLRTYEEQLTTYQESLRTYETSFKNLESQLQAKRQEIQQLQDLMKLKNLQIQQLSMKSDAIELKYNSFFDQMEKRNKEEEELSIFNRKKIAHLLEELEDARRTISQYEKVFQKHNESFQLMRNQLIHKDAKIESLQRHAERLKTYQQITNLKPLTQNQQPWTQITSPILQKKKTISQQKQPVPQHKPVITHQKQVISETHKVVPQQKTPKNHQHQRLISDYKQVGFAEPVTIANYKKVLKKVPKHNQQQQQRPPQIQKLNLSFKKDKRDKTNQSFHNRNKTLQRYHNKLKMTSFRHQLTINQPFKKFPSYSFTDTPNTPTDFHSITLSDEMFATFCRRNEDSFSKAQHQPEMRHSVELRKFSKYDEVEIDESKYSINHTHGNINNSQFASRNNENSYGNSLNSSQQHNSNTYQQSEQRAYDRVNDSVFHRNQSNLSLENVSNDHSHRSRQLARFGEGFKLNLNQITKNHFEKSKSQKLLPQQKSVSVTEQRQIEQKIQTEKKPLENKGGIRKNITPQNVTAQKISNQGTIIKNQRITSKETDRKESLQNSMSQLIPLTTTKHKTKLIRTMRTTLI